MNTMWRAEIRIQQGQEIWMNLGPGQDRTMLGCFPSEKAVECAKTRGAKELAKQREAKGRLVSSCLNFLYIKAILLIL
jgi:hypothetical protein